MIDDVIGVIILMAILGAFFGLGMTVHQLEQSKEWECTATAVLNGKAECVEYRRNNETI